MHTGRPRIRLSWTFWDVILECAGWLALLLFWMMLIVKYNDTSTSIPTHFDLLGNPDAFGHKSQLFMLPVVASLVFIGLTWLNQYPHIFNFPIEINAKNAETQYRLATRFLRWMKAWTVLLFFIIALNSMNASEQSNLQMNWLLPIMLFGVFVGLITYLIAASRKS